MEVATAVAVAIVVASHEEDTMLDVVVEAVVGAISS
jgi:hypothetical protein